MKNENKDRRGFLKIALTAVAGAGIATISKTAIQQTDGKKVKMLTPEGKLVEVDESVILKMAAIRERATNREVQDWMKTSKC